eukprot:scaffold176346_cov20-Prasinocladus_malaysianus.AAC.1
MRVRVPQSAHPTTRTNMVPCMVPVVRYRSSECQRRRSCGGYEYEYTVPYSYVLGVQHCGDGVRRKNPYSLACTLQASSLELPLRDYTSQTQVPQPLTIL